MNNKVIIGVIVVALLVVTGFVVKSNKATNAPPAPTMNITSQITSEPTSQATASSQILQHLDAAGKTISSEDVSKLFSPYQDLIQASSP